MALTRLTDRIKMDNNGNVMKDKNGNELWIRRYGMWGTNAEIEIDGKKVEVVQRNGSRKRFKTKEEAEVFMKTLL